MKYKEIKEQLLSLGSPEKTVLPHTMLRYAIEKLSPDERAHYMAR